MDLTDLLTFVSPGSFSRVKRWADDGSNLWDFTSAASIQASLDACVTWGDGVTPPTGQAVFDKMAEFTADQAAKVTARETSNKITGIKAEAERRILAIMDKNKQRNLLAHGLEAIFEYGPDPAQWPAADRTLQQNTMPKWRQIKAIRAASDALEAMNPIPDNYTDDIHWP